MANRGDAFTVTLKEAHLDWGEHRNPTNREPISGEGYIPIPRKYAVSYSIYNSNHNPIGWGYNLFRANSADGFLRNVTLLAQGSSCAGDIYAKQFSVQGDLQMIGAWYRSQNAQPNNVVRVAWQSPDTIMLEII